MKSFVRRILALILLVAIWPYADMFAATENKADAKGPKWNVRYAVCIWGIDTDYYLDGGDDKAGLTFGPITGGSYIRKHRSHLSRKEYEQDPDAFCIHWMSWDEIADQSLKDPTVFHDCLLHNCTHSVDILLNDRLLCEDCSDHITGDGCGALLYSIKPGFHCWNAGHSIKGGWPASRARVTLNGADELSSLKRVKEEYMLSPEECLFSCFPEDLQKRIVAKKVVVDLDYDNPKGSKLAVTYDKLWLFAGYEIYGKILHSKKTEGDQYERNTYLDPRIKLLPPDFTMASEKGGKVHAWLRSASVNTDLLGYHMFGGGHIKGGEFFNRYALSPGFCLP